MTRRPTTRLHVSGHRFVLRRLEHALVRRDVRMVDEPLRSGARSFTAGCVLAVTALAGCALVAYLRPSLGDSPIVMAQDSGALFVRVGDTLHPVLNLASARLIVGTAADPAVVRDSELANTKRGAVLGIPGAPATIDNPLRSTEGRWVICDRAGETTVIAGGSERGAGGFMNSGATLFVRSRSGPDNLTYVLYDGRRARVSRGDRALARALRLEGADPIPVSSSLLNVIPEVPPLAAPRIDGVGQPGPRALQGLAVGTVVRVARADGDEYYVVGQGGVQRIGTVVADLLRFEYAGAGAEIESLPAGMIAAVPPVKVLDLADFPNRVPAPEPHDVVCAQWAIAVEGNAHTEIYAGAAVPLASDQAAVALAQADGAGPGLDAVFVPPGRVAYVRANGLHVVTDTGVRFAISDTTTARTLGLAGEPIEAPWSIVRLLPEGPRLSKENALIARDVLLPDAVGVAIPEEVSRPAPR